MLFTVVQVIDSNTLKIFPKWRWNDLSGNIIGIRKILDKNWEDCGDCEKLKALLLNKTVECRYPEYVHRKKLLCDVIPIDVDN